MDRKTRHRPIDDDTRSDSGIVEVEEFGRKLNILSMKVLYNFAR